MIVIDQSTKSITMSKGDTVNLNVAVKINDVPYTLSDGDYIMFSIKSKNKDTLNDFPNFVSKVSNPGQNHVNIVITNECLADCQCGEFMYDIKLIYANGNVYTLMFPASFTLVETIGGVA